VETSLRCERIDFLLRVTQADDRASIELGFFLEDHRLLVDFTDSARGSRDDQAVGEGTVYLMDTAMENLVDGAITSVTCSVNEYLKDVTCACATVNEGIVGVDRDTVDESRVVGQLTINDCEFACLWVDAPELNCIVVTCDESLRVSVEKLEVVALLLKLVACWTVRLGSSFGHVPDYELVAILDSSKTHEVRFITRERQGLNGFIMIADPIEHVSLREVPDDDGTDSLRAHLLPCS